MPYFSVIIPSYNREKFLTETISSVMKQDFTDFEILIIDDGSTDDTKELARQLNFRDSRVHYFYKENGERGAARNFGIKNAKGKYIVFLDSDDQFLDGHLRLLHKLSLAFPKCNFFATKFDFIENKKIFKAPIDELPEGIYDFSILKKGNPFACNICIKKENEALVLFIEDRKYAGMEDWIFLFANTWSQDLYLAKETTVRMNEHPARSMRFNLDIIEKRLLASWYILENFSLYPSEKKRISGFTSYFCAIHYYLENKRKETIKYTIKSIRSLGLRLDLLSLLLKLLIGKKMVGKIKEVVHHR